MRTFEELKKDIHKKGFNISMMLNKFKKMQKERKALYEIPEEVFYKTCFEIERRLEISEIENPWPYFMTILTRKSYEYFAGKSREEAEKSRFPRTMPQCLSELFKGGL